MGVYERISGRICYSCYLADPGCARGSIRRKILKGFLIDLLILKNYTDEFKANTQRIYTSPHPKGTVWKNHYPPIKELSKIDFRINKDYTF